jgi:hypothetical protein
LFNYNFLMNQYRHFYMISLMKNIDWKIINILPRILSITNYHIEYSWELWGNNLIIIIYNLDCIEYILLLVSNFHNLGLIFDIFLKGNILSYNIDIHCFQCRHNFSHNINCLLFYIGRYILGNFLNCLIKHILMELNILSCCWWDRILVCIKNIVHNFKSNNCLFFNNIDHHFLNYNLNYKMYIIHFM